MWCACMCACSHMWGCKDTNENTYMDVRSWDSVSSSVALHSIYWGRVSSLNPELYTSSQSTKLPGFRDLSVPPQVWGYRSCNHVHGHLCEFWGSQLCSSLLHGRCILQRHLLFLPSFFLFRTHLPSILRMRFLVHFIKKKIDLILHTIVCFIHSHDQQLTHPFLCISKENITLVLFVWLCISMYT